METNPSSPLKLIQPSLLIIEINRIHTQLVGAIGKRGMRKEDCEREANLFLLNTQAILSIGFSQCLVHQTKVVANQQQIAFLAISYSTYSFFLSLGFTDKPKSV